MASAFALASSVGGLLAGIVAFGALYAALGRHLPDPKDYPEPPLAESSVLVDGGGEPYAELVAGERRVVVDSRRISPALKDAVVAIEDRRFYRHSGLDFRGIARAAVVNVLSGTISEGGSTLTQQLIKNRFVDPAARDDRSFARKWFEGALSWRLEKERTKREILTDYLNTVYFGGGAYGAEAASRTFFSEPADELDLPEAATLAGMVNLPGFYDPYSDPESVVARRNVVLAAMLDVGYIDEGQYEEAKAAPLVIRPGAVLRAPEEFAPFVAAVRAEVARDYGEEALLRGGLRIETTLDPRLQRAAVRAADAGVDPEAGEPSAALAAVDPGTGRVLAVASETGKPFHESPFNLATQAKRQPGSTFKTFVLAAAVRAGIPPDAVYDGNGPLVLPDGTQVNNYREYQWGPIAVRKATIESVNTAYTRLALSVGMPFVVETARAMGIREPLEPYPSTAIGGLAEGVTPLELAGAYATIPSGGVHHPPRFVEGATRRGTGEPVGRGAEAPSLEPEQALTEYESGVVADVLRSVVADGHAEGPGRLDGTLGFPSAGKTGTSELFADAWYAGFASPGSGIGAGQSGLAAVSWVGYPEGRRPMVGVAGYEEVNGEKLPLDVWESFMLGAREDGSGPRGGAGRPGP